MKGLRFWLGVLCAAIVVVVFGVLGFCALGMVRPDLVFAFGGRLVPGLGAFALGTVLGIVFRILIVMRTLPTQPKAVPLETEGERAARRTAAGLSGNVSASQAAAVLVPFGIFAALAVGIMVQNPGGINLMTTDSKGNVYLHEGDSLLVADPAGRILTEAEVKSQGVLGSGVSDLQTDEAGTVYFADPEHGYVTVLDQSGHRTRTIPLTGLDTPRLLVGLAARDRTPYIVAGKQVVRLTETGSGQETVFQGEMRYPSGIAFSPTGEMVIADSDNSRILVVKDGAVARTVDFSNLPGAIRYPTDVRCGPNGEIYTIVRQRDRAIPPVYWRGKLYDASGSQPRLIDLAEGDKHFDVLAFSMLPDGRYLFVPLGQDALYIGNPAGQNARWAPGQLTGRLASMSRWDLFVSWGPTVCLTLGIAVAVLAFVLMLRKAVERQDSPWQSRTAAAPPMSPTGAGFPPAPPASPAQLPRMPGSRESWL